MNQKRHISIEKANKAIAARIRHIRRSNELTLAEISDRSGINIASLSMIERGKRRLTVEQMMKISAALKVDYHTFIEDGAK